MKAIINSLGKLFAGTWDVIRALAAWLLKEGANVLGKLFNLPPWVVSAMSWIAASFVAVAAATKESASFVLGLFSQIFESVGVVTSGGVSTMPSTSGMGYMLQGANTFFPMDELFAFLTAYSALIFACYGVRMLKSCVPIPTAG